MRLSKAGIVIVQGFCLALGAPTTASAGPKHELQAGVDLGFHAVRDDTLVPLAFSGPRVAIVPRYFGELGPGVLVADVRFGLGYVVDQSGAEGITLTWSAHANYLPILHEGKWSLALGPALGWDNDVALLADWDDAHAYWIGTSWLGPGFRAWHWLTERWRLDVATEIGVVGWQSRPPAYRLHKQETSDDVFSYVKTPTKDLQFGSLLDWQVVHASVELYRVRTRARTPNGWGLGSELGLQRATDPAMAFVFNASLRLSYTWSL